MTDDDTQMSLCSTCSAIDLLNIPTYPEKYTLNKGSIFRPTLSLLQLWGPWIEDEVSQFGVQFHRTFEDLLDASNECAVCVAVLEGAYVFKNWLAEMNNQDGETEISKYLEPGSAWEMRLTKYSEDTDNILVISFDAEHNAIRLISTFRLCVAADSDPLSSLVAGRCLRSNPTHDSMFDQVSSWLTECNREHALLKCCAGEVKLPTRVLDVGIHNQTSIQLYEAQHASGKYAALSYMWGHGKDHFRTTVANLDEHKARIDIEAMPQTFQDAVIATRRLGLRYLWIDALCIVQDDIADWDKEAAKMADVYSDAYIVLSVLACNDDGAGFLSPPETSSYASCAYNTAGLTGTLQVCAVPRTQSCYVGSEDYLWDEPLSKRGWTLQERWLAPRLVHFGSQQMMYECNAHFVCQDGTKFTGRYSDARKDWDTVREEERELRASTEWTELVSEYSLRKLTRGTDKLPAISGIARMIGSQINDQYVAGLWRKAMIEGLSWECFQPERAPDDYQAPSWSWASVNGPVLQPSFDSWRNIDEDVLIHSLARVLDCEVKLKGKNIYGEVVAGSVTIEGLCKTIDPLGGKPETEVELHLRQIPGAVCRIIFDTTDSAKEARRVKLTWLMLLQVTIGNKEPGAKSTMYQQGIVVAPTGNNLYRRLGKLQINYGAGKNGERLGVNYETRILTII